MFIKLKDFYDSLQEIKNEKKQFNKKFPSCFEYILSEYLMIKLFADFEGDMAVILNKYYTPNMCVFFSCIQMSRGMERNKLYNINIVELLKIRGLITVEEANSVMNLISFRNNTSAHSPNIIKTYKISDVEAFAKDIKSFLKKLSKLNLLKL